MDNFMQTIKEMSTLYGHLESSEFNDIVDNDESYYNVLCLIDIGYKYCKYDAYDAFEWFLNRVDKINE